MKLLFLHGFPGVGKLTVAQAIGQITNYPVFHNHLTVDLVSTVFEFGSTPFIDLRESIWLSIFERAAKENLPGLIFTFSFESTIRTHFLKDVLNTVNAHGGEVLFIELKCKQEELEKRLVNPSREPFKKLQSVEVLKTLIEENTLETPPGHTPDLIVDNTELNATHVAQMIVDTFNLLPSF